MAETGQVYCECCGIRVLGKWPVGGEVCAAADLCAEGHEADTVAEEGLAGAADRTVLEGARVQGRVLLKLDQGIADNRVYPAEMNGGAVCEFGDAARCEVC